MARIEIGKHLAVDTRVCGGRLIFILKEAVFSCPMR